MDNKKTEIKRLIIYIALSFGLAWLIFFAYILNGGKFDSTNPYMEQFVSLGMLAPFAANLLTRAITKEGFALTGKDSLMLGISFKDKKWIIYIFAAFIPWLYFEVTHILMLVLVPESFDTGILSEMGLGNEIAFIYPLITIVTCSIASFAALGEEGGWRGYMMPKLMKLMSVPKAIIVGGVIWGIWHAPLTCVGHNFGTDYPGFPYVGILIMCVYCILMGIILTYVTIKTNSIWPAAIMHAVNNGNPTIMKFFINAEVYENRFHSQIYTFLLLLIPMVVINVVIILIEVRKKKNVK